MLFCLNLLLLLCQSNFCVSLSWSIQIFRHLINFLGGKITFIDNSPDFIKICKGWYHDIRLIEPTGTKSNHTQVIRKLVKQDGSSLETDDVNDPLTDSQWIHNLSNVESEEPWDVIVIDGAAVWIYIAHNSQNWFFARKFDFWFLRLKKAILPNKHRDRNLYP